MIIKGSQHVQQHLVQWEDTHKSQSTWEDHNPLQKAYLDFNLENKVVLNGGGIISNFVIVGINELEIEKVRDEHVITNLLYQERRKSSRNKIINSRLSGYDWSNK